MLLLRLIGAGIALCLIASLGCGRPAAPPVDLGPLRVTVINPVQKKITAFTELTGNLAAVGSVDVRPRVSGYILKVNFKDGSEVKKDQVLVEIDPSSYQADLQRARGELMNWQAQFKLANADFERFSKLRKTGAITQEELDKSAAQVEVAKAKIFAAEGEVQVAELNLGWTKVTAPIDGKIDRIYLTEGNVATGGLSQGTVLTTIVTEDPIYAYLTIDEQRVLKYLRTKAKKAEATSGKEVADTAIVEIQLKGESGYPHRGTIDFASNRLDPATGTLQLRAVLPNPGPVRMLIPGMFIRARIPTELPTESLLIPDAAVVADQAGKIVYVVDTNNRVESRKVLLGPMADGLRVVLEGLKPDGRVVIRGMQRITDGMTVEVEEEKISDRSIGNSNASVPGSS